MRASAPVPQRVAVGTRRGGLRPLLASSSLAALLVGAGAPAAFAAGTCKITVTTPSGTVTNPTTANCINVIGTTITGNVANTGSITTGSGAPPTTTGITINSSTVTGAVTNSGTISANNIGILIENGSTISGGIDNNNSGTITASGANGAGILVGGNPSVSLSIVSEDFITVSSTISTFSGGITNSGTITASGTDGAGIMVGGNPSLGVGSRDRVDTVSLTISTFSDGISNSGTIMASGTHGVGILVGGNPSFSSFGGSNTDNTVSVTISTFSGGIADSGTITASGADGVGILVGGNPSVSVSRDDFLNTVSLTISTFSGGITNSNSGLIIGHTGILVGGNPSASVSGLLADGQNAASVTISAFSGGISSSGTISAGNIGIWIGGSASASLSNTPAGANLFSNNAASVTISTFSGGISNSGTISAGSIGIWIGGSASASGSISGTGASFSHNAASVTISAFSGGISNSGTISAANTGIWIGGSASGSGSIVGNATTGTRASFSHNAASVTISALSGGISNSGTIAADNTGIWIGGSASASANASVSARFSRASFSQNAASVTMSAFSGGISNSGTISVGNAGIWIGGSASASASASVNLSVPGSRASFSQNAASVTISAFSGGIGNSGTISAGNTGIWIGGSANASASGSVSGTGAKFSHNAASVTISTFSGGISNSGMISAANIGIWIGGSASASASVSVSTGASFSHNAASVTISTFSGGISNSGTIAAGNVGIFIGGSASASGGHSNSASVTVSTFSGGIANSGLITGHTGIVVGADVLTFSGAIANSGTISGTGGTAIDVSGANNAIIINQSAGLIAGAIKLSANADMLNISGGAIAGNIIGAGSSDTINFNMGAGTFTYGSAYGFTGINQVTVNSGTAILDGESNATTTTVNGGNLQIGDAVNPGAQLTSTVNVDGGTLSGHGTIAGAVTINGGGTLSPGGSIGTLTITNGPLTFAANSLYAIQLNDTAASNTVVNGAPGTAIINGGTVEAMPQYTTLGAHGGTTFTILTATGGRTGTFSAIAANAPNFTGTFSLSYDADDVFLDVGKGFVILPSASGATVNEQNVLNGINNAILAGDTVPGGFNQLLGLSGATYLNALQQVDGEDATGAERGAFDLMNQFLGLMLDPFVDGRSGSGWPMSGGLPTANNFAPEATVLPPDIALAYAGLLKAPPAPPATLQPHWTSWGAGFGGSATGNGDPTVGSNNVTTNTYGYAAGMDYHYSRDTVFGFSVAGGGTGWNLAQGLGTGRSDAFLAGIYGVTHHGPWYLGGALAFANNWFTTNRTAMGDALTANFQGQSYSARLEGGYRFAVPAYYGAAGVTPYAAIQAQSFHTPAYSETDLSGGAFGLSYNAMNGTDTRSELGGRFDDLTAINNLPLILRAKVAWAHDWVSNPALDASFESLPGSSFTVNGAPIPQNSALASAGAQLFFTPNWSLAAKFDGEFADGYQLYAGSGTLRYTW